MNLFNPKPVFQNPSKRLVTKSGIPNIRCVNIESRRLHFLFDFFTTLLELRWRLIILIILSCFMLSWLFFTALWFALVTWHEDLSHAQDRKWVPCIWNINSFASVLLFSIETQTTIGYGYRYVSEECPIGILLLVFQSVIGAMLQALLAGTVLAKIQLPKRRRKTVIFSKRACVCLENTELCLMFRVGNLRRSEIVGAQMRAIFIRQRYTSEGEFLPHEFQDLKIGLQESGTRMHLWWPTTIIHIIDQSSPLWLMTPEVLRADKFEILLILEGSIASTSLNFQGRTSYLPEEIEWGHRFQPMFRTRDPLYKYDVNFEHFDDIRASPLTPKMSAKDWRQRHAARKRSKRNMYTLSD